MQRSTVTHQFVEYVPREMEDGVVYVSIGFATAIHRCCCGCGNQVVTPLSPAEWSITFNGRAVTLHPSIGNWSFPCQSHYWIRENRVVWERRWTREEIRAGRATDRRAEHSHFGSGAEERPQRPLDMPKESFWRRCAKKLFGR